MLVSKLSLVIRSTRLDVVDSNRLDQVIDLLNCDHELIRVDMWILAKSS